MKPVCHIVAGPNGSGKSTFALDYLPEFAGRLGPARGRPPPGARRRSRLDRPRRVDVGSDLLWALFVAYNRGEMAAYAETPLAKKLAALSSGAGYHTLSPDEAIARLKEET